MNLTIYSMEMKRNFKSFLIWSLSICGILFFGMLFYPAINADGLLLQMEALFENPMMKGLLSAFGADLTSLASLTGFYVTYNSIYNVLLACIFVSIVAANLLAKEEAEKTAEFLYTRPVSRRSIFISKTAVLLSYVTILSLLYFLTSLVAMNFVKADSPVTLFLSPEDKKVLINAVERHPGSIYKAFNINEDSFGSLSLSYAAGLLNGNRGEMEEMDLDPEAMNSLLSEAEKDPEGFFSGVLENPDPYMSLFSFPLEKREEFLENVRGEMEEYKSMKEDFFRSPELFLLFFEADPSLFLNQFSNSETSMDRAIKLLELPSDFYSHIFKAYSVRVMFILSTYVFLLLLAMSSLVLLLSLLVKRGKSVLGTSLGIVFFFYFLNSISSAASAISPAAKMIGYISPFTWMDTDFSVPDYGIIWWKVALFLGITALSLFISGWIFKRKDILI
ncbi:ABC transporter permease subunit [Spirochaeta isovalerica]|uniref:ABC-type transport system involved in multi-copper enzyme maturation permease subunit n=1 Tax=Spirochaeta isovalerica TaxID=150 RepID=A0A841RF28_9SPIO|nr:ABC transporter permease subunit [Spirochaeta isovalerica]MBB6480962.1 ABC-type transport system involved in multi-copper enzyme maturation permease subunit [Spirochaeta isovalerica]